MRVALTIWKNCISPLFDSARTLLIADIDEGDVIGKKVEALDCQSPFSRAAKLDELGVKILICGGISYFFANLIEAHHIRIIPFAAGDVDEVLEAYAAGELSRNKFRMPGCRHCSDGTIREAD